MMSLTRNIDSNRITVHSLSGVITMQKEQQQQWVDERIRSGDMVLESILKAIWTIEHSDQEV